MGVVNSDQPLAIRPGQPQRVVQSMRLLRRRRYPRDNDPDPVATLRIHHENLPVEVEKHVEGGVTRLRHVIELSY
jgi:hypothetical protein